MPLHDKRRSIDTLQAGRALAALAVCLYHTNLTLALPKYLGVQFFPLFNFGDSGVYYFFVLSGFVIYLVHAGDIGRRDAALPFLWKRCRRIYPPLWGILLLLTPILWMVPSFEGGAARNPGTVISAFLALPANHEAILGPEWTLRHEVLFYFVFAMVIWRPWLGVIGGALWLGLSAFCAVFARQYPGGFFFSGYHLLFAFGVLTCCAYRRGYCRKPRLTAAVGIGLFFLMWGLNDLGVLRTGVVTSWGYGVGASLSVLGGAALEQERDLKLPTIVLFLGEASYSIYLVNLPAISLICKLWSHLPRHVPGTLLFWVTATLAVGIGIAFHLLVEKPLVALFRQRWRWGRLHWPTRHGLTGQHQRARIDGQGGP